MLAAARAALAALLLACAFAPHVAAGAEEVPFVRTPQNVVAAMLRMAGVRASDFVIDLGSGDGRILLAAARDYGARGLGVDLDSWLVRDSNAAARAAGVADRITFVTQDFFTTDLAPASVLTLYLLPDVNLELRPRILAQMKPGSRVVSHDWDMGDWPPDAKIEVDAPDKPVGVLRVSTVYLWIVPARVAGHWRSRIPAPGGAAEVEIELEQAYQTLTGSARIDGRPAALERAYVNGRLLFFRLLDGDRVIRFEGKAGADRLTGKVTTADGRSHAWRALRMK